MASGMNWKEPETKHKFLLAILATNESSTISNAKATEIAKYMGCTVRAVTNQFTALRKEIDALKLGHFGDSSGTSNGAGGGTPSTPTAKSSMKKRKAKTDNAGSNDDGGSDDPETPTPSKKAKSKTKTTPKAKTQSRGKKGGKGSKKNGDKAEDSISSEDDGGENEDEVGDGNDNDAEITARKDAAEGRENERGSEEENGSA